MTASWPTSTKNDEKALNYFFLPGSELLRPEPSQWQGAFELRPWGATPFLLPFLYNCGVYSAFNNRNNF
jgi:hypothetical protein